MPVASFVCPHCEKHAEVQVTSVTRSRPCPHCGEVVVFQVAAKDRRSKRRAVLVAVGGGPVISEDEELKGVSGPAYDPMPLEGEVFERMKMDPEVREFRRRFIMGAAFVVAAVILTSIWHLFSSDPSPRLRPPVAKAVSELPKLEVPESARLPKNAVGLQYQDGTDKKFAVNKLAFKPPGKVEEPEVPTTPAVKATERFLQANSLTELLASVADRSQVEPFIRAYASAHPITKQDYKALVQGSASNDREGTWSVMATMKDGSVKEVHVVLDQGEPRVDWPSYVAWSAMEWAQFMEQMPSTPMLFRVLADQEERYDNNFADAKSLRCVRLQNPMNPESPPIFAYVDRGSVTGSEIDFLLRQSSELPMKLTLRLKFPMEATSKDQVWIDNVITAGWLVRDLQTTANVSRR